ncbi:MAG TPA: DEAD/DEAH box helicase [Campylobacterales bacterium]|nr:DEAD/DEAH box helicase [Campylobacterales bacterium]
MTFEEFGFKAPLFKAIEEAGFKEPSPVQEEAMPIILRGEDIVAQAHTGTGKTAAFGLPILNMLKLNSGVECVIIAPTRELAMQVSDEIFKFGRFLGINTATIYGGSSYGRQIKHINNSSVIVATPGRFLDLLDSGKIEISPSFVVLDEADEMLDMGFLEDIKNIFAHFKCERQTLMFSATMPQQIKNLSKTILKDPKFVTVTKSNMTNKNIKQNFYVVEERERDDALIRLLDFKDPTKCIIFCRMKKDVDRLSNHLMAKGYAAKGLHGDMEQRQREEVIKAFKRSDLEVLIATDVAARGLDVSDVSHVFNYQLPFDSESYVHRIGRTGRAGREGIAISIVTPAEFNALNKIQKDIGNSLESKVIPTIQDVQMKQKDSLMDTVKAQAISDLARNLVDELKKDFVDEDIALKLASMIYSENDIAGSDRIGKNISEISRLMDRYKNQRSGGGGNSRNRGRNHRGGNRNRSGNGRNRNRSGGGRDRNRSRSRSNNRGQGDR